MNQQDLYEHITETSEYLHARGVHKVDAGIILGSGLGRAIEEFNILETIDYRDIPNMPTPGVIGHGGQLIFAETGGKRILIFSGRIHYYEGYPMWRVAFPVRVISRLGAEILITTGAVGGLSADLQEGDLLVLRDHINLMPDNPLRGPHDARFGVRFPDMSQPYDPKLRNTLVETARDSGINAHEGVYAALPGPNLETRSEYAYLHKIGADCVGMSVVPEVLVAIQENLRVLGLMVISNVCFPAERVKHTTEADVVRVVGRAALSAGKLLRGLLAL